MANQIIRDAPNKLPLLQKVGAATEDAEETEDEAEEAASESRSEASSARTAMREALAHRASLMSAPKRLRLRYGRVVETAMAAYEQCRLAELRGELNTAEEWSEAAIERVCSVVCSLACCVVVVSHVSDTQAKRFVNALYRSVDHYVYEWYLNEAKDRVADSILELMSFGALVCNRATKRFSPAGWDC